MKRNFHYSISLKLNWFNDFIFCSPMFSDASDVASLYIQYFLSAQKE